MLSQGQVRIANSSSLDTTGSVKAPHALGSLPNFNYLKGVKMKRLLVALTAVLATTVWASPELAKAKGCMACHQIEKKVIGPSYKDVAAKYKEADVAKLVAKVQKGGKGVWGPIPMPANAVSDADARILVEWILKQK